ncbi:MAG TPA: tRNA (adenosine(37)-N6)-dimethylallyltransferase MiaA [Sediminibacterium sp.]|nr:tRNA (adenosine(37)-N6)-dimethylallyltransferase MiaA [Sediminibacterium sp.]
MTSSKKSFPFEETDSMYISRPTVIVIAGPTGVGKTSLAIELARQLHTAVISADSRQCYREMKIGVARPSDNELAAVPHYFIASHSVTEELNAADFEAYAMQAAEKLLQENDVVIMAGGTGLYIRAFCEGIDPMPVIPAPVREAVRAGYARYGLIWLQKELAVQDPAFWQVAEQKNPHRLMRALEVLHATGKSILDFRTAVKKERPFRILLFGLGLPKEILRERIDQRVDKMMEEGLLAEVRSLLPYRQHTALQTVGYRELFDHLDGNCNLTTATDAIRQNTWHYAKRQMTWFRKMEGLQWLDAADPAAIAKILAALKA